MEQWEYCRIENATDVWLCSQLTSSGERRLAFEGGVPEGERASAFAKLIAKLGSEGWEMVGCGPYGDGYDIYFKRPK